MTTHARERLRQQLTQRSGTRESTEGGHWCNNRRHGRRGGAQRRGNKPPFWRHDGQRGARYKPEQGAVQDHPRDDKQLWREGSWVASEKEGYLSELKTGQLWVKSAVRGSGICILVNNSRRLESWETSLYPFASLDSHCQYEYFNCWLISVFPIYNSIVIQHTWFICITHVLSSYIYIGDCSYI